MKKLWSILMASVLALGMSLQTFAAIEPTDPFIAYGIKIEPMTLSVKHSQLDAMLTHTANPSKSLQTAVKTRSPYVSLSAKQMFAFIVDVSVGDDCANYLEQYRGKTLQIEVDGDWFMVTPKEETVVESRMAGDTSTYVLKNSRQVGNVYAGVNSQLTYLVTFANGQNSAGKYVRVESSTYTNKAVTSATTAWPAVHVDQSSYTGRL